MGSAAVAPPPSPSTDTNKDVLKLSKTDSSAKAGAAGKGGGADRERLNALQEEVTAKDKALKEAQSRVSDLEKQIRDMQRLLDLKGAAPAKPDTKVAEAPKQPAPAAKAPEPAAPAKVEPAKPAEPVKAPEPPKAEAPKPDATKPAETTTAATTPTPTPTPAPSTTTPPAEPPKVAEAPKQPAPKAAPKKAAPPPRSTMEELMDSAWFLPAVGIGAAALLAGGIFAFMRRRRNTYDNGPSSAMTSAFPSDLKPEATTGKAGGLVDTGNSSFLTDFDKTGPGTIDTDEVDPVAEAEVYIAYGRDAQAEEILKEAMARDKGRHEIALKLLEIYHARKSATAFETVAKELRSSVGESHPLWQKAAAMGAQIDPSNPLYVAAAGGTATYTAMAPTAPASPPPKPDLDFDLEGTGSGKAAAAPAPDFDLGDTKSPEDTQRPAPAPTLDFDLAPSASAPMDMPAETHKEESKPSFDFDLSGLDFPGSKPGSSTPAPAASSMDMTDLNLDLPGGDTGGGGGGGEAVGTKLELAKAYLEIGDKDGAREILQEVAKEGSSAQKAEAQKLIASL